jgi:hypothetical protein
MQTFYPVLRYEDARAAMEFLERAFGFETHASHEGENGGVMHAELRLGDQYVMLGSTGEGEGRFNEGVGRPSSPPKRRRVDRDASRPPVAPQLRAPGGVRGGPRGSPPSGSA